MDDGWEKWAQWWKCNTKKKKKKNDKRRKNNKTEIIIGLPLVSRFLIEMNLNDGNPRKILTKNSFVIIWILHFPVIRKRMQYQTATYVHIYTYAKHEYCSIPKTHGKTAIFLVEYYNRKIWVLRASTPFHWTTLWQWNRIIRSSNDYSWQLTVFLILTNVFLIHY